MQPVVGLVLVVVCLSFPGRPRRPKTSLFSSRPLCHNWGMDNSVKIVPQYSRDIEECLTSPITWNFLCLVPRSQYDRFVTLSQMASDPDVFRDAMLQRLFEEAQNWAAEHFGALIEETPLEQLAGWTASEAS